MPDNQISVDDTSPQYNQVSVDSPLLPSAIQHLTSDVITDRSAIASLGLSNTVGIPHSVFKDAIATGQEGAIREEAASKLNQVKIDWAKQLINQYGNNLPDGTLQTVLKAQDPKSVFEEHYANAYMNFLDWPKTDQKNDNWAWTIADTHPEAWDYVKQAGSAYMAKFAYIQDKYQDAYGHTSWWDIAKSTGKDLASLGFYGELKMRTGAGGTGTFTGLGLGSNLEEQAMNLWDEPDFNKFKSEVDRITSNLPPDYASSWLKTMVGQTSSERIFSNLMTGVNAATLGSIGAPLAKSAINRAFVEANARLSYGRLVRAATDMTTPRPAEISPAVAGPSMAGNTAESGIRRVVIDNLNEINQNNNPITTLTDRMLNLYDTLNQHVSANPGNFGREVANRLSDMINGNKENFVRTVMDNMLARGDRTPTVELEEQARAVHAGIADMFRGPDNMVLDISHSIYIPGLNVRMYNVAIGTHDAAMFGSIDEARAVARRQGWIIKGDYNVTPEEYVNVSRKLAAIRGLRAQGRGDAADKIQAELDKLPKHDTGITIEYQNRPGPVYSAPIGPTMPPGAPVKPTGALKPKGGTPTAPTEKPSVQPSIADSIAEAMGRSLIRETPPATADELAGAIAERLKGAGLDYKPTKIKSFFEEHPNATFEDWIAQVKDELPPQVVKELGRTKAQAKSIGGRFMREELTDPETGEPIGLTYKEAVDELKKYLDELKKNGEATPNNIKEKLEDTFPGLPADMIRQQGAGYYIFHTVFLPEEADFVRDGLVTSKVGGLSVDDLRKKLKLGEVDTGVPNDWTGGWINAILGRIRAPSERLSTAENLNRIIATHGPSVLLGMLKDGSAPVAQMPKRYWKDFNRFVRYLQNAWNEDLGTTGIWFDNPWKVDNWYRTNLGRSPHETELQAYFAYRTLMLDDLNMRNLSVMQRKLIMGAKQYAVTYMDKDGNKVTTPFFEGVAVDRIPDGVKARVLDVKSESSKSQWMLSWRLKNKAELEQDVADGRAKIIQVFDPASRPLSDVDERTADYIITYTNQEKPLGFDHVSNMGGGHMIPKWGWFLKQAKVKNYYAPETEEEGGIEGEGMRAFRTYLGTPATPRTGRTHNVYEGDGTLLSFKSKAEAQAAIPHLERVRELLLNHVREMGGSDWRAIQRWENEGGTPGSQWYQAAADEAAHTGIPFDKLTKWWLGPNAPYDIEQPIRAVPQGGKIIDLDNALREKYPDLIDTTRDGSLQGRAMSGIGFLQDRDNEGLYTLRRTGTESNPAYAYEPAPWIDPITAMERGYGAIAKTMFMYDMKKFSMEHWLEQARPWLQNIDDLRTNPLKHFYSPQYLKTDQWEVIQNLESNRQMALDFIGRGDETSNSLWRIGQAIHDAIYRNSAGKRQIAALYDLPKETDYYRWMRNVAFYSSQISLKTYFTQASTIANVYAIAGPQNASKATAAMMMYGWWKLASGKPEILQGLDNALARYMGWQPGRFTEAVQMMEGSGMAEGQHFMREGASSAGLQWAEDATPLNVGWRTMQQAGKTLLDWGAAPFSLGTATTRRAAFFAAYLETLEKAPGGIIDRGLRDAMLGRASLLDSNMSTAFNMKFNKGAFSIPFQFASYDTRMAELMWGKQLTPREKAALFSTSAVMFGLRGGFYASLGIPIANYVLGKTETALGYVPGDNPLADMVVNGFPSWMFAMLSGFTDEKGKRTWVDFSRWGNRGIQPIEDFIDSDKTMLDIAAGAFGSVFGQAWNNTWGMRRAVQDIMRPDGFKMTSDDVLQAAKTLSLYTDINRTWLSLQTGKLLTRNSTYVTDIGPIMATIQAITGLSPIEASDVWIKQKQLTSQDEDIKRVQKQIAQEIMRAALAGDSKDTDNHVVYMRNAAALLRFIPPEKWGQTMSEAMRDVGMSLRDRVDQKLYRDYPEIIIRIRQRQ